MLNLAYELGAALRLKNKLEMTPLMLAARLAHKELFFHVLKLEREIYWQLGRIFTKKYECSLFYIFQFYGFG